MEKVDGSNVVESEHFGERVLERGSGVIEVENFDPEWARYGVSVVAWPLRMGPHH